MGPYEELFRDQRPQRPLGDEFEQRVMGKIHKKKRQRRRLTVGLGLVAVFALGLLFLVPGTDTQQAAAPLLAMEEIPLLEEVTFSASGLVTEYPLELVSLTVSEGGM